MPDLDTLAARALHDDFDATTYDAIARDAIREAVQTIYRTTTLARGDYVPAAIDLPAGALGVTLTETALRIASVRFIDTGDQLAPTTVDEVAAVQQDSTPRSRPSIYAVTGAGLAVEGMTLIVAPIPDQAYQLQLVGRFAPDDTALDTGTDMIPLPSAYALAPVEYARSVLFALEGDTTLSAFHLGRWDRRLAELRADLMVQQTQANRRVPGTWSGLDRGPRFHYPGLM